MENSDKNIGPKWSKDDMHSWLNGDMDVHRSRDFEKDLRRDPFLRDAVSGFEGHTTLYIDHHLERLTDRFADLGSKRSGRWWLPAAAILALLLAAGWLLTMEINKGNVAMTERGGSEESAVNEDRSTHDGTSFFENVGKRDRTDSATDEIAMKDEEVKEDQSIQSPREPKRLTPPPASTSGAVNPQEQVDFDSRRAQKSYSTGSNVISGKVIDADGSPLSGARIYFPANRTGITTGRDGRFAVELNQQDDKVSISHPEFEPADFPLHQQQNHTFQLIEGLAVLADSDEVQEEGDKESGEDGVNELAAEPQEGQLSQAEKSSTGDEVARSTIVDATPVEGHRDFEKYVEENLNYPEAAKVAKAEGRVIVQFKVLPDGELFDFRIIQGLGYGCDEEALRLIREGPKWKPVDGGQVGKATYTVLFEM